MGFSASSASSAFNRFRAAIRDTALGRRLAIGLWVAWAFVVWNVVFDRVLVLAGRRYVYTAFVSANQGTGYVRIDDWMRPAAERALLLATGAAAAIAIVGVAAVVIAVRRRPPTSTELPRKS